MENDSIELVNANRTIAKHEGLLESIRDELALLQQTRQA